jgi:threonine synthase
MHDIGRWEGISCCLEGAATLVGLRVLVERGLVGADETIVLLNTGSALTTPQVLEADFPVWEERAVSQQYMKEGKSPHG